jgi:hypothetical protein
VLQNKVPLNDAPQTTHGPKDKDDQTRRAALQLQAAHLHPPETSLDGHPTLWVGTIGEPYLATGIVPFHWQTCGKRGSTTCYMLSIGLTGCVAVPGLGIASKHCAFHLMRMRWETLQTTEVPFSLAFLGWNPLHVLSLAAWVALRVTIGSEPPWVGPLTSHAHYIHVLCPHCS